jgi:hypothetical protein
MSDKDEGFVILADRRYAPILTSWTQYLCLAVRDDEFVLSIKKYTLLDEEGPSEDEDGNPIPLPTEIDGHKVTGVDDGYIVGEPLVADEDFGEYRFSLLDRVELRQWLANEWEPKDAEAIATKIEQYVRRWNGGHKASRKRLKRPPALR